MEEKTIIAKRTLVDFLLGAGIGAGMDLAIPVDSDGTLSNTLREALFPLLGHQVGKYGSMQERVTSGTAIYIGSVVGQTAYHLLKNL